MAYPVDLSAYFRTYMVTVFQGPSADQRYAVGLEKVPSTSVSAFVSYDLGTTWALSAVCCASMATQQFRTVQHPTDPTKLVTLYMTRSHAQGGTIIYAADLDITTGLYGTPYGGVFPVEINSIYGVAARPTVGDIVVLAIPVTGGGPWTWATLVPGGTWGSVTAYVTGRPYEWFMPTSAAVGTADGHAVGGVAYTEATGSHWTHVLVCTLAPDNSVTSEEVMVESAGWEYGSALAVAGNEIFLSGANWSGAGYIQVAHWTAGASFPGFSWLGSGDADGESLFGVSATEARAFYYDASYNPFWSSFTAAGIGFDQVAASADLPSVRYRPDVAGPLSGSFYAIEGNNYWEVPLPVARGRWYAY